MAKKREAVAIGVTLHSPNGGPAQVGTGDDPRDIDADGNIVLDPVSDSDMIESLTKLHGFTVVEG